MSNIHEKSHANAGNDHWPWGLGFFKPAQPSNNQITDADTVQRLYKHNQKQVLIATIVGYAMFYFVRKNMSVAMPLLEKDVSLGVTKETLGAFLTAHGVIYGVSKFANGFLGDRCNGRAFMVAGLMACALINAAFAYSANLTTGMSATLWGTSAVAWVFGIIWVLNGWFQGMGFPPCARLMTHWFPPRILAMKMSIWNTSHSIGTAAILFLGGHMAAWGWGWKAQFYVPAGLALITCFYLWAVLKDTPESMGLPPVETLPDKPVSQSTVDPETAENLQASLEDQPKSYYMKKVFQNPYIWIIALANFFVYAVRYAILDWGPTLFSQAKHFNIKEASYITTAYELAGIGGMLAAGWITDNIFGGRGARTCFMYMALCTLAAVLLWRLPLNTGLSAAAIMCLAGFSIYGPQALVGIAVANLGTKHAAATAVGLTGLFGYLSTTVSGWGVGKLVDNLGWSVFFEALVGFAAVGTILFALAWAAPAHGYKKK